MDKAVGVVVGILVAVISMVIMVTMMEGQGSAFEDFILGQISGADILG